MEINGKMEGALMAVINKINEAPGEAMETQE